MNSCLITLVLALNPGADPGRGNGEKMGYAGPVGQAAHAAQSAWTRAVHLVPAGLLKSKAAHGRSPAGRRTDAGSGQSGECRVSLWHWADLRAGQVRDEVVRLRQRTGNGVEAFTDLQWVQCVTTSLGVVGWALAHCHGS